MLTREEVVKAEWYKFDYDFHEADQLVRPFLNVPSENYGWLKRTREALFLSRESVALKLQISRQAYSQGEENERKMRLEILLTYAEAMDCELVYAIRPKERILYSERIWRMLDCMRPTTLGGIRKRQYYPEWRHRFGWVRNGNHIDPHCRQYMKARKTGYTNSMRFSDI